MNSTSKLLCIAVAFCGMLTVGCEKVVEVNFVNHTAGVVAATVTTPLQGTRQMGSVGANGGQIRVVIRIPEAELPAPCSVSMGVVTKPFEVNRDTDERVWFHLDEKGLAGPMTRDDVYSTEKQTGEVRVRTQRMTVD